jgi:tRNA threonylcarbamoyladenosine biosynthesis protein TsaE
MPDASNSSYALDERYSSSPEATEAAGRRFAARLQAGDRIALTGDLGAGKTCFVRGVVAGLGSPASGDVASPTFALHHRYPGGRLVVDHCDLYRLRAPVDPGAEGFDDLFAAPKGALLVEWPQRLGAGFRFTAEVRFGLAGEDARRIAVYSEVAPERWRGALA